jgi:hypothetical protein
MIADIMHSLVTTNIVALIGPRRSFSIHAFRQRLDLRKRSAWVPSACHYCFLDDPRTQRIVVEPKLTNTAIVSVAQKFAGMTITKWFDFPHKRSALLEVSRERFFQLMPLPSKAQEAERQVAKL